MKSFITCICMVLPAASVVFGAAKGSVQSSANNFFDAPRVHRIEIKIGSEEFNRLKANNRSYVAGIARIDDQEFAEAGIRLKGRGSFKPLGDKPSFAIKFNQFMPGQKLFGLSKIMLNNASQDSTYLSEYVATGLFRDAKVPAARVAHARVSLNGRDLGIYVLIEAMNASFLQENFKTAKGNLYEGYARDLNERLEQDNGGAADQSDLQQLVAAARLPLGERKASLSRVLEIDECYAFLAMSMLIAQHDSYPLNRNNYRIYRHPETGRFTMIPHGIDGTFRENNISITPPRRYVLTKALLEGDGAQTYRARAASLYTNAFRMDIISNRIAGATEVLKASAASEEEKEQISRRSANYLTRIQVRHARAGEQLAESPGWLRIAPGERLVLTDWKGGSDGDACLAERRTLEGKPMLYLKSGAAPAVASWHLRALLAPGRYRFSGKAQTSGAAPPNGASLRAYKLYANAKRVAPNNGWQLLEHAMQVPAGEEEVELICDVTGHGSEAWFDLESLTLTREL
jgi:hypothetical protein